ncbi:DUF1330 domain-containing protein [Microbaculum marinum]|uniref:DUF1330 domain-containing protein n=1 Tax=Microbaculum marinum TaxID=1764581 RepID=A0AAW9RTB7_9HYPH
MTTFAVFVQASVTDPEALDRYSALTPAARGAHPLEPLAFYCPPEGLAGHPVDGIAILSYPTMEAAKAGYRAPRYRAALPHRLQGTTGQVHLVAGTDG